MNIYSDEQAIDFLTNCGDLLNQQLEPRQLECLCNELIDTFFVYLENVQNYKREQSFELSSKQAEIELLNTQIMKQNIFLEEQKSDLYRQVEICQQLEQQLQFIEIQSQKSQNEILKVEAELRKKLHQQNQQYREQIQTLTHVQQETEKQILQLEREKAQIQFHYEQLIKKYEEQQFMITDLTQQLDIVQQSSSANTQAQQNNEDCIVNFDSQDISIDLKYKKQRAAYTNCVSHNQLNFRWEKVQPSISTIRNSLSPLNPNNTRCEIKSLQKIRSIGTVNFCEEQKKCDPYYEFFKLLTQCVKLDLGQIEIYPLNLDYLFEKFKSQSIPFNKWYKKIIDEVIQ